MPPARDVVPEGDAVPTYQYQCTDCGEALEVVQAFTDDSLTECPNCGGKLELAGKGIVTCPYCGVQIFLS